MAETKVFEFFFIFFDSFELLRTPGEVSLTPGDVWGPLWRHVCIWARKCLLRLDLVNPFSNYSFFFAVFTKNEKTAKKTYNYTFFQTLFSNHLDFGGGRALIKFAR